MIFRRYANVIILAICLISGCTTEEFCRSAKTSDEKLMCELMRIDDAVSDLTGGNQKTTTTQHVTTTTLNEAEIQVEGQGRPHHPILGDAKPPTYYTCEGGEWTLIDTSWGQHNYLVANETRMAGEGTFGFIRTLWNYVSQGPPPRVAECDYTAEHTWRCSTNPTLIRSSMQIERRAGTCAVFG